jgi:hypothetical protein
MAELVDFLNGNAAVRDSETGSHNSPRSKEATPDD